MALVKNSSCMNFKKGSLLAWTLWTLPLIAAGQHLGWKLGTLFDGN